MTELAIMSLGVCPECQAEFPAFYSPVGSIESVCDECGWASDHIPFEQRLLSRRAYLVLAAVDAGTPSYVAFEAVSTTAMAHPEWDMEEVRRVIDWRADDETPW